MNKGVKTFTDETFDKEVLHSKLPVLVDFWAPWCGPCRIVAPILDELARDFADKAVIGKVNTDENMLLSQKYQIRTIPTLLLIKDGKIKDQFVGLRQKEELAEAIRNVMD